MPIPGRRLQFCLTIPIRAERAFRHVASSALIRLGSALAPSTSNHPHLAQSSPAPTSNLPPQPLPEAQAETNTPIIQPSSVPPGAYDSPPPSSPAHDSPPPALYSTGPDSHDMTPQIRSAVLIDSPGQQLEDANSPPRLYARRTVPLPAEGQSEASPSPPQAAELVEDGEQDGVLETISSVAPQRAANAVPTPDYVHVQHLRTTAATLGVSIPANSTGRSAVTAFGDAYAELQDLYAIVLDIASRAQRQLEALQRARPDSPTLQQEIGRVIEELKRSNPEHTHNQQENAIVLQYGQV